MNTSEPEILESAINGSHLNASVLGKPGGISRIGRLAFREACLDTAALSTPMLFTGEMPRDRLTLVFVRQCPSDGHSFNFSTTHREGVIGVFAPGCELDAATPAGYVNATFSIPLAALENRADGGGVSDEWLTKGAVLSLPPEFRRGLEAFLADLETWSCSATDTRKDSVPALRMEDELMDWFLGATSALGNDLAAVGRGHQRRRYGMMRRVRDYLREHSNHPVRVNELCEAVGMSRRGLEYLFRDLLGVRVNAFIRRQRLYGARRAMLTAVPTCGTVKRIALEWGFWHLGRFSSEYRALFGESPISTLGNSAEDSQ